MTASLADLFAELDRFKAWKLNKYTQPFEDGKVEEEYYECSLLVESGYQDGDVTYEWKSPYYGHTPEVAIERALEEIS